METEQKGIGQELSVVNVSKYYGTFRALTDINLVCKPGEFVSILGSSGSGKTTLLKVIAGFERCSDGKIFINGKDVATVPCFKRNIGMLFQNYALFPHLTVAQNIAYPLKLRKLKKDEIDKKVKHMIELIKLTGLEDRYPRQLSGGQQQRVAIARALALKPDILCFDEPTSALDPELTGEVLKVIRSLAQQNTTMIIVTHEMAFARDVADQVIFMDGGVIVEHGDPHEVIDHPKEERTRQFLTRYANG